MSFAIPILVIGIVVVSVAVAQSRLFTTRRAFDAHEKVENDGGAGDPYTWAAQVGMTKTKLHELRFKNYQKNSINLPRLENIVSATVADTIDNKDPVITLCDVNGKCATLWMKRQGDGMVVRTVTDY